MFYQFTLHFKWTNTFTRGINHVVITTLKKYISFLILICQIPRNIPTIVFKIRGKFIFVSPNLLHQTWPRRFHRKLTYRTTGKLYTIFIQYADSNSWKCAPHRSRIYFFRWQVHNQRPTCLRNPPLYRKRDTKFSHGQKNNSGVQGSPTLNICRKEERS